MGLSESFSFQPSENPERFKAALDRFDAINAEDTRLLAHEGKDWPQEQLFSRELTGEVCALVEEPSEALILATRCQHIRRWERPRADYPEGRTGYLKWRSDLKDFHAEVAGEVLKECGYEAETIERIQSLNRKERMRKDPECQALEDGLCLVFLRFQAEALVAEHPEEKVLDIFKKTKAKMSEAGIARAVELAGDGPLAKYL